jgi:hypothetical protein
MNNDKLTNEIHDEVEYWLCEMLETEAALDDICNELGDEVSDSPIFYGLLGAVAMAVCKAADNYAFYDEDIANNLENFVIANNKLVSGDCDDEFGYMVQMMYTILRDSVIFKFESEYANN